MMRNPNTTVGVDNSGHQIVKLEFDYLTGDGRYVLTSSGGSSTQVTGSDNFFVTNILKVSGTIINTTGDLILSSSNTSQITISGNLNILGYIQQSNLSSFTASMIQASSSFANVSSSYASLSASYTQISGNFITLSSSYVSLSSSYTLISSSYTLLSSSYGSVSSSYASLSSSYTQVSSSYASLSASYTQISGNFGTASSSFATSINNLTTITSNNAVTGVFGQIPIFRTTNATSGSNSLFYFTASSLLVSSGSHDFPSTNTTYHVRSVNSDLILSSSSTSLVTISGGLKLPLRHIAVSTKTTTTAPVVPGSFQTIPFDTNVQLLGITRDTTASFYVTRNGLYEISYGLFLVQNGGGSNFGICQVFSGSTAYSQGSSFSSANNNTNTTGSFVRTFFANINSGSSITLQLNITGSSAVTALTASGPTINSTMCIVEMG